MKIALQLNTGQKFIGKSFGKELSHSQSEFGEVGCELRRLTS